MNEQTDAYAIPVTQYMLPYGQSREVFWNATGEQARRARAIVERGLSFEAEILTTNNVSVTVHDPEIEEDIAGQVCLNGPEIHDAMRDLINEAFALVNDK